MKGKRTLSFITLFMLISCNTVSETDKDTWRDEVMIRMAEIEIDSAYVEEYKAILKQESEASVRLEPGVICIYPMFEKESPSKIKLLEIYASKKAYESHIQSPHFKTYKERTFKMVKELKLVDMEAIDSESMAMIFKKLEQ